MEDRDATFESLDPEDWGELRQLGHRMVDDMLEYLRTVRERPVWRPIPAEVAGAFREPLPTEPAPAEAVYEEFREKVLPFPTGNIHPRFWGWVMGTGTPGAMLAEMLAAGLNLNQGGGAQAGGLVERQVIDWCKEMVGFPADASGILVSGGSMANLVGMTVARNARAGFDVRNGGLDPARVRLVAYASREVHSSVPKAMELLGLGRAALREVSVNDDDTIDLGALREAIAADRAAGHVPFLVVGCAGTVATGALDPLDALAGLCAAEGLWFHVDGAFGALAALSPGLRPLVSGMERADSVAFDLHKWMSLPYEIGVALVRDPLLHRGAFALTPAYLEHGTRGIAGGDVWFSDYGVELSRGFRALKAWMALKEHGAARFGRIVLRNVEQARALGARVAAEPALELLAPVALNVVCFRYRGSIADGAALDALNRELLLRLHEGGAAAPSYASVRGKYALRACITNHRTRHDDLDVLVRETLRLGRELEAALGAAST
ncbi:MAG: amino acid decarboxylase [Thermoanaerobaculia bacterium]|nr:amino acid decarboxylase [Thermoanaerobaculia bacterium]